MASATLHVVSTLFSTSASSRKRSSSDSRAASRIWEFSSSARRTAPSAAWPAVLWSPGGASRPLAAGLFAAAPCSPSE